DLAALRGVECPRPGVRAIALLVKRRDLATDLMRYQLIARHRLSRFERSLRAHEPTARPRGHARKGLGQFARRREETLQRRDVRVVARVRLRNFLQRPGIVAIDERR